MGCDYYIIKQLRIEHSNGTDTIELDKERCYFSEYQKDSNYDSDDSGKSQHDAMYGLYGHYLKVTFIPRILCENSDWKSEKIKEKYIDIVYNKLKHYNNAFSNINTIIKEEVRYFRYL
jgi:hypothetical protein